MNHLFSEIALALIAAAGGGLVMRLLKQPPLLGYLIAGTILGPLGFHSLQSETTFKIIEELGIALLLFLIGLELNWEKAKQLAGTVLTTSSLQVLISVITASLVTFFFTGAFIPSLLIGIAVTLSSTVLVVKILSESHDLASLHGRLSVGTLLFHDAVAILIIIILASLVIPSSLSIASLGLVVGLKIASFLALLGLTAKYLLPQIFTRIAGSPELLFVCTLAWCFFVASISEHYGIPIAIGAFLAGISLAPLPYALDAINRLRSVRDVFVILLFLNLGAALVIPDPTLLPLTVVLLALVVLGKPLISFLLITSSGYKHRTAFLTSASQGQLSEFSLIIISMAVASGSLSPEYATIISSIAACSLFISTLLLTHREWWYLRIRAILHHVTPVKKDREPERMLKDHIIIFGYHRMGYHILKKLSDNKKHHIVVVDFNPEIIKKLSEQGIDAVYGDVQDEDILHFVQASRAAMIISTVPHRDETLYLLEQSRAIRDDLILIVTSHQIDDALLYYKNGANYVILPHLIGGEYVANLITNYEHHHLKDLIAQQAEEVKLLKARHHALYYE